MPVELEYIQYYRIPMPASYYSTIVSCLSRGDGWLDNFEVMTKF